MSLNWNIKNINDYKYVCYYTKDDGTQILHPTTDAIIWLTLIIGIGTITEKNVDTFYSRVRAYELMRGAMLYDNMSRPDYIEYVDIVAHIGLVTNSSKMTDAQFRRHLMHMHERDVQDTINRFNQEIGVEAA